MLLGGGRMRSIVISIRVFYPVVTSMAWPSSGAGIRIYVGVCCLSIRVTAALPHDHETPDNQSHKTDDPPVAVVEPTYWHQDGANKNQDETKSGGYHVSPNAAVQRAASAK